MDGQRIRLFLELPGETVVIDAPRIGNQPTPSIQPLEAVQLPFPPAYDPTGKGAQQGPKQQSDEGKVYFLSEQNSLTPRQGACPLGAPYG